MQYTTFQSINSAKQVNRLEENPDGNIVVDVALSSGTFCLFQ